MRFASYLLWNLAGWTEGLAAWSLKLLESSSFTVLLEI